MNNLLLLSSFGASLCIHLVLIPVLSLGPSNRYSQPRFVPFELIDIPPLEQLGSSKAVPSNPTPEARPKTQKINAPKLLSKPQIIGTPTTTAVGNTREKIKEPEKIMETLPRLASLPPEPSSVKGGWNRGSKPGEAEGSTAGAGNLFNKGDVGVVGGSSLEGGGGGQGNSGLGRGAKGEGSGGGGVGAGEVVSGLARPLSGYQVKPLYPESARKAGAQGITLLKLRVLENGKVGEVQIEQSAGHPDLDMAAADAVRQWLFEPARMGKQPIAVWVLLPVKFELH
jgi:TonB family protein